MVGMEVDKKYLLCWENLLGNDVNARVIVIEKSDEFVKVRKLNNEQEMHIPMNKISGFYLLSDADDRAASEPPTTELVPDTDHPLYELVCRGPFGALGLADTAEEGEIRRATRQLMRTHHTDKGGDVRMAQFFNYLNDLLTRPAQQEPGPLESRSEYRRSGAANRMFLRDGRGRIYDEIMEEFNTWMPYKPVPISTTSTPEPAPRSASSPPQPKASPPPKAASTGPLRADGRDANGNYVSDGTLMVAMRKFTVAELKFFVSFVCGYNTGRFKRKQDLMDFIAGDMKRRTAFILLKKIYEQSPQPGAPSDHAESEGDTDVVTLATYDRMFIDEYVSIVRSHYRIFRFLILVH